jgi:hypothetical protein
VFVGRHRKCDVDAERPEQPDTEAEREAEHDYTSTGVTRDRAMKPRTAADRAVIAPTCSAEIFNPKATKMATAVWMTASAATGSRLKIMLSYSPAPEP